MAQDKSKSSGSLLIKGGRLIDPAARIDAPMDVLVRGGRVAEIAPPSKIRGGADEKFDARHLIVAPGFIDLHVHLREPGHRRCCGRGLHIRLLHAQHFSRRGLTGMGGMVASA